MRCFSMGGIKDSSTFFGFDYTYVGSKYGAIVQALIDCKTMNPVLFFDDLFNRQEINEIGLTAFNDSLENIDCVIVHNYSSIMEKIFTKKYDRIQLIYFGRNMMFNSSLMRRYKVKGLGYNPS